MPPWGQSKDQPLAADLAAQPVDAAELTLTVAAVERIVGVPLSPSARTRVALRDEPPTVTFARAG